MHAWDYTLIVFYLVLPLLVGPWLARRVKSSNDLFSAGNQSPWWLSGLSAYMTMFSSGTFVVWGGIAFKYGLVSVSICMALGVAALLVAAFLARRWRNTGANSAAEFIYYRYGPGVVQMYTWLLMAARLIGVAVSIYSLAVISCELMPIPSDSFLANEHGRISTEAAIVIAGIAIIGYTVFGGLWSVLVTDMMQFVVLTSSVAIVVPLIVAEAGGVEAIGQSVPEGFFSPVASDFTWWFLVGWIVIHAMKIGGEWAFVQRLTCVPTPRDAVLSATLFGLLYLVTPIVWMTPAMVYRVIDPIPEELNADLVAYYPAFKVSELSASDQQAIAEGAFEKLSSEGTAKVRSGAIDRKAEAAYIRACRRVAPVGLLGMMMASMFAATASMANSELNVLAGAITNDIYAKMRGPAVSESHLVAVGRVLTVLIGALFIALALAVPKMGGAEGVILTITGLFVGPMVLPTIWGLFSDKIGAGATVLTVVVTAACAAYLKFGAEDVSWIHSNMRVAEILVGTLVPAAVLILCELLGRSVNPGAKQAAMLEKRLSESTSQTMLDLPLRIVAISLGTQSLVFFVLATALLTNSTRTVEARVG
ncbi:sodium:solute symporter family transporter [Aeoliella mucimassa]|uniref:Sodium/glucose cotransporter n=1 Tax=Aeoliella mucimassa TaxID=2527972 RepID=A0A518AR85_9BACT|nr:Na+:solute symporter [Aeoliella mucimassa]QDU57228.1 Sodium/glucose cotransporter [Aeoliella mucimassa]